MSTTPSSNLSEFQSALSQAVREHWKLFLVEGIILVILGILAIFVPVLATIGFTIFLGWIFLISGMAGLITTFGARQAPGFWWSLLSAILGIAAGIVLLVWPLTGAVSLTFVLIAFFIIEGVLSIMRSSTSASSRDNGAGCCSAASSISFSPASSLPVCLAPPSGRSASSSVSTCCSAAVP
jgi:uncharacterized membrane protein HdeD (DUF308 family)